MAFLFLKPEKCCFERKGCPKNLSLTKLININSYTQHIRCLLFSSLCPSQSLHLPSTLPALLSMTVTFSFKFFFASFLISQPLPSGIQQKPRSTSEAFKVKVCTEVQNEMAHPSAPFCNPITKKNVKPQSFSKKTSLENYICLQLLELHPPLARPALSRGKGTAAPGTPDCLHSAVGKAQHTYDGLRLSHIQALLLELLPPYHPRVPLPRASPRVAGMVNKGKKHRGIFCLLMGRVRAHRQLLAAHPGHVLPCTATNCAPRNKTPLCLPGTLREY